jgi:hypothetical protein
MTTISKALVVLITAVSLAFCGFAITTTAGGPNWEEHIRELPNYKIVLGGDSLNPVWQATTVRDEPVQGGQHKVLAKVLIACLEDQNRRDGERIAKLNERAPLLEAKLTQIRASLSPDETALHEHAKYLREQIAATAAQVDAAAKQVIQKTDEIQQIENRTRDRYQDVVRLEAQVNEVRADQFRLSQIRQQLIDQISQVDALLDRARERNEQLYNPKPVQ